MRLVGGYQNTRINHEDIALTPYIFGVYVNESIATIFGIGLCWGFIAVYIGIGFNIPKGFKTFRSYTINKNNP